MTMGMHVGIILLQDIVFLDLIALNLILLDFSSLRDGFARRLALRGPSRFSTTDPAGPVEGPSECSRRWIFSVD